MQVLATSPHKKLKVLTAISETEAKRMRKIDLDALSGLGEIETGVAAVPHLEAASGDASSKDKSTVVAVFHKDLEGPRVDSELGAAA